MSSLPPIRVLQLGTRNFGTGGISTIIFNLGKNIDSQKIIFDYLIIGRPKNESYLKEIENKGGKVFFIKNNFFKLFNLFFEIRELKNKEKYKIVHINISIAYLALIYSFICYLSSFKIILVHSHAAGIEGKYKYIKKFFHKISKAIIPLFTTEFIACSHLAAEWMFPKKYLKKIFILKNGIDSKKFKFNVEKRKELRKKLLLENSFVLGHIGRMVDIKNHRFIIEIFKEIKLIIPESKLLLIGTGPLENELKKYVKNLNLEKDVLFLGVKTDVENYLQVMDIFLFPSKFEGLGIVGVEAQASGLNCLISNKVPKEIKCTDFCEFLSINDLKKWIVKIKEIKSTYKLNQRDNSFFKVKENGYDIKDCAENLKEKYLKLLLKKCS